MLAENGKEEKTQNIFKKIWIHHCHHHPMMKEIMNMAAMVSQIGISFLAATSTPLFGLPLPVLVYCKSVIYIYTHTHQSESLNQPKTIMILLTALL